MDYQAVAKRIIQAIHEDNIKSVAHCATRLRFVVKDRAEIDEEALKNDPDIVGVNYVSGQYQLIIGAGKVNEVYDAVVELTGKGNVTASDEQPKQNSIMALIKVLSDIFVPLLPALVAGGLLMALNNVLTAKGLFGPQSIVQMYHLKDLADFVNLLASAPFTFLPILVGYSATKRFGGDGFLGAALAAAMVMPSLVSGYDVATVMAQGEMSYWHIFGLNVAQAGYQGQVLPILVVSWMLAKIEIFCHKKIPKALDFTFVPLISILITGFLTFIVVGPVVRDLSDMLTNGLVWLYNTLGGLGTGIFGLFYSPIVISGLHQSFPAIETTLLADIQKTGGDFIFPIACMANTAQAAACLAVFFISKDQKQRSIASSASLSALLGITEPAIFGINLQLKFPFFCGMIASGIASIFIGMWKVLSQALGSAGLLGFISIVPKDIPHLLIATAISFVLGFLLTIVVGKRKMQAAVVDAPVEQNTNNELNQQEELILNACVTGEYKTLDQVEDQVFSEGMMGQGFAVVPAASDIYAPCDGVVQAVYETKHAYGIETNDGRELLIHIGIDTVELNGEGFDEHVKQGDKIKQGDLLATVDFVEIAKKDYRTDVMVIGLGTQPDDIISLIATGSQVDKNTKVMKIK